MRTVIKRTVMTVLAVLLLASQATAAPIAIGWLQWGVTYDVQGAPASGQFSIVNQTGANYLFDPSFPVVDQLLFNGDLTLTTEPGSVAANLNLNSDGISYDSDPFLFPLFPTQASLTGTVSPLQVLVDVDGGGPGGSALWNILGGITDAAGNLVVLGDGINPITDGDLAVLYVDAAPAQVPEPSTMLLLGSGAIVLLVRRRRASRA
jgi:hypothetical protein